MKGYYIKKVISSLFVLFIIITLNFFLPRLIFSDPAEPYYAGVPEDAVALRNSIREEHGFNDPLIVQYGSYLKRVFTLDFGNDFYNFLCKRLILCRTYKLVNFRKHFLIYERHPEYDYEIFVAFINNS